MTDAGQLAELSLRDLTTRLASADPVPGGGSAAAIGGAMAAALVGMVVELSAGRPAYEADDDELRQIGAAAGELRVELLRLADRDAAAYRAVIAARRLPRDTGHDRRERLARIADATREATLIPLRTAQVASEVLTLAGRLVPIGNPNAASDAGAAAHLAAAAVEAAGLNVQINLPHLAADDPVRERAEAELLSIRIDLATRADRVLAAVASRIGEPR